MKFTVGDSVADFTGPTNPMNPTNPTILNKVREAVHAIVPDADIILFGSRARGDALDYSDWDFLILTEKQPHFELVTQIRDKLYEIELEMDTILSAIIRSRKEWESGIMAGLPFKQEVEKDGVRI